MWSSRQLGRPSNQRAVRTTVSCPGSDLIAGSTDDTYHATVCVVASECRPATVIRSGRPSEFAAGEFVVAAVGVSVTAQSTICVVGHTGVQLGIRGSFDQRRIRKFIGALVWIRDTRQQTVTTRIRPLDLPERGANRRRATERITIDLPSVACVSKRADVSVRSS
jgi:hypothetical protein